MRFKLLLVMIFLGGVVSLNAQAATLPLPGPGDKCPVCGMFCNKYRDFLGHIDFRDGRRYWFDGAKDLFKFYLNPGAFGEPRPASEITAIIVTDYYSVQPIDARSAFFVLGSDVFGPMGHELIPFGSESEAREFMGDHRGTRLVRFNEVNAGLLTGLE